MKQIFIHNILYQNAYQAAVTTRNKEFPVFKPFTSLEDHLAFKNKAEILCNGYIFEYKNNSKPESHIERIRKIGADLSKEFNKILFNDQIRFGIIQKVVNLYMKFLWCINDFPKPPHCPIDGIVRDKLIKQTGLILPNWTEMDEEGYNAYLNAFEKLGITDFSEWELEKWHNKFA